MTDCHRKLHTIQRTYCRIEIIIISHFFHSLVVFFIHETSSGLIKGRSIHGYRLYRRGRLGTVQWWFGILILRRGRKSPKTDGLRNLACRQSPRATRLSGPQRKSDYSAQRSREQKEGNHHYCRSFCCCCSCCYYSGLPHHDAVQSGEYGEGKIFGSSRQEGSAAMDTRTGFRRPREVQGVESMVGKCQHSLSVVVADSTTNNLFRL